MIKLYFILIIISSILSAKIIEVNQLFNKKIVKVKVEEISFTKSYYGITKIDESQVIDIVTRFDGYITKLYANKSYMQIKRGEKLFDIYSDKIKSIQKEIEISKNINNRLYKSSIKKLISLGIDNESIAKIKNSSFHEDISIKSPINAIVLKKNINSGSAIKRGQLLLRLANIQKLWFLADIYQKDLSFIKNKMEAKIYLDGIPTPIKSRVDYIYPIVDKKTKTFKVRFQIDNRDLKYFPNMFGVVKIQSNKRNMLTLPKTAVFNKGGVYYVFKPISDREFEPIKVSVKRVSPYKYEILSGLKANQKVIDNALFLLDSDAVTNGLYDEDDEDW